MTVAVPAASAASFDVLPPGDIRNCMVALSEDDCPAPRNAFSISLSKPAAASKATKLRKSLPDRAHRHHRRLSRCRAQFRRGSQNRWPDFPLHRRQRFARSRSRRWIGGGRRDPHQPNSPPYPPYPSAARAACALCANSLDAIARADLITLGPGSLFTSVIPQSPRRRNPQSHSPVACAEGVFRESHVAAG